MQFDSLKNQPTKARWANCTEANCTDRAVRLKHLTYQSLSELHNCTPSRGAVLFASPGVCPANGEAKPKPQDLSARIDLETRTSMGAPLPEPSPRALLQISLQTKNGIDFIDVLDAENHYH